MRARMLYNRSICPSLLGMVFLAGCSAATGPEEESTATTSAAVVDTDTTVAGANAVGSLPDLPGVTTGARPWSANSFQTGPDSIHDAVYSNGLDLADPPVEANASWLSDVSSDRYSSASGFRSHLQSALEHAQGRESELGESSSLGELGSFLERFGVEPEDFGAPVTASYGYPAARARWQKSQSIDMGASLPILMSYADPNHMEEIRMRGARKYCAAREAVRQQGSNSHSMGEIKAGSVDIFNRTIDFLVVEPTVAMAPPERFAEVDADGAQAFSIPFMVGTRLTPVRGIGVGGLPEVRTPVTLVTGDTEVLSKSDRELISGSGKTAKYRYNKSHKTVTTADAIVSSQRHLDINVPDITLASFWRVVTLYLGLGFEMDFGAQSVLNDRAIAGAPSGWAPPRPGAPGDVNFFHQYNGHDYYTGAFGLSRYAPPHPSQSVQLASWFPVLKHDDPFILRALQDNDHVIQKSTGIGVNMDLGAKIGPDFNWGGFGFYLNLDASGGVTGNVNQKHTVRDAMFTEMDYTRWGDGAELDPIPLVPVSSVEITPSTDAAVDFVAKIEFGFGIKLFGVDIPLGRFSADKAWPLGRWDSGPWPERNRMRLGTGSSDGDVMKQPDTTSHFPQSSHFASFPQDVDTCLADDSELPPAPPPSEPAVDTGSEGSLPSIEGCIYAPVNMEFITDACAHIDSYIPSSLDADQKACVRAELEFICDQTNQTQWWDGGFVASGVIDMTDRDQGERLAHIASQCHGAFGAKEMQKWLRFGACEDDATLINPEDAIRPTPDDFAGTPTDTENFWDNTTGMPTKRARFRHSSKCMDVSGSSQSDGANVLQYTCNSTTNQRWTLVPAGPDTYMLKVRHSGKCLTVVNDPMTFEPSLANGANVVQSTCHGGHGQLFEKVPSGSYYLLKAKHSNLCLDVAGSSTSNGANVLQYTCHGTTNQQVTLY